LKEDVAMTDTKERKDFNLDYLLHPAGAFSTPQDVLNDPSLTAHEKRAILACWASDCCAVGDDPTIRRPPNAPPVRFDDVMDALKTLNGPAVESPHYPKLMTRAQRLKDLFRRSRGGGSPGTLLF
jgi:hypothetical protein